MRIATLSIVATMILSAAACSTTPPASASTREAKEAAALARYQAAAGSPVSSINNFGSPRWDTVDGSHIVYVVSPKHQYLMTLSGPCMDWATGAYIIGVSSDMGRIYTNFDRIYVSRGPACSIKQIQPLDAGKLLESAPNGDARVI
ncbi:MAG: hypothetical protein JSR63_04185 [Proteobacteria bacterium]|nr:hypothetical protein [Pseudomonadota bacterium]MBS0217365.1 hypothetical protein [Pseudomonadota bacterium]